MSQRRSDEPSRGFTVMVLNGPGEKPRRLHVPHWVLGALFGSWLVLMAGAAWLGYESRTSKPARAPAALSGSVASRR